MARLTALVLGAAAGGGFPQWNCRCPICALAWASDPRVLPRTQSSVALTARGDDWLLVNASPDLRSQILANARLWPRGLRDSPIADVVLTNGDVDHVAGLLTLRERSPLTLWAAPPVLQDLAGSPVFGVLDPALVRREPLPLGAAFPVADGLEVEAFAVPGKAPLYREGEAPVVSVSDQTIGLEIRAAGARLVLIPGCAEVDDDVRRRVDGADCLLFDGTLFTDDEMIRIGAGAKTGRRMGHLPISGPGGSIEALAGCRIGRRVFLHINNTNPILVEDSPERRAVEAAGWDVAHDGMEIAL